jgi:hypothetical protein
MDIKGFFGKLFGIFGKTFRSGLDRFVMDQLAYALRIGNEMLERGQFSSTDDFARALWRELRGRFSEEIKGTWLTILAGFATDALKAKGKI